MAEDPRIDTLVTEVKAIKKQVCENSIVVNEVRDILSSFRFIASVARWCAVVGAGVAVIWAAIHGLGELLIQKYQSIKK